MHSVHSQPVTYNQQRYSGFVPLTIEIMYIVKLLGIIAYCCVSNRVYYVLRVGLDMPILLYLFDFQKKKKQKKIVAITNKTLLLKEPTYIFIFTHDSGNNTKLRIISTQKLNCLIIGDDVCQPSNLRVICCCSTLSEHQEVDCEHNQS